MDQTHLSSLNPAQRAAVVFDVATAGRATPGRPLLIIAGAGSGKTKTLAHRVAHLMLNGADPGRILLLTFTRRAAEEMTRRVERICGQTIGGRGHSDRVVGHLPCRRQPAPAALCRADRAPAQLHGARPQRCRRSAQPGARRAGPQRAVPALPQEGDLPCDLLLRRQRPARPRPGPSEGVPLVPGVAGRAQGSCSPATSLAKQAQAVARLRRSAALLVGHDAGGSDRERRRPPFRLRPGRRVPGHQRAPGEDPARAQGRRARPHGGRRRCPVDLRLSRRDGQEHPGFPGLLRRRRPRS